MASTTWSTRSRDERVVGVGREAPTQPPVTPKPPTVDVGVEARLTPAGSDGDGVEGVGDEVDRAEPLVDRGGGVCGDHFVDADLGGELPEVGADLGRGADGRVVHHLGDLATLG